MRPLTLRQLDAILAVHATGKIVSAARQLGLTQPAVSLKISEAEAQLGTQLFDRTRQGLRPTAAGDAVIAAALSIDARLKLLGEELDGIKSGKTGRLRLGVVSTAKYFAPAIMAGFLREHPSLDVTLWVGNRAETIQSLEAHRVDIALMGRPPREVPVRAMQFGEHPFVIIAPVDHPLARAKKISKQRIAEESFLVREPGSGTRTALDVYLSELPGRIDNVGLEMGSNETIKQAVMAGLGIALISGHTVAQELESKRLIMLDVDGLPIRRQWFSVSRADRSITAAMRAFEDFLARDAHRFLPALPAGPAGVTG